MRAKVTIQFRSGGPYKPGDYVVLFGNGGSGDIDYDTPLSADLPLYPDGVGVYGFYRQPWGNFPWGHGSFRGFGDGFYHQPWGHFPWNYGSVPISASVVVSGCGSFKFAFKAYDSLGNPQADPCEEITAKIHIAPDAPSGLEKKSYNKETKVLVLDAA